MKIILKKIAPNTTLTEEELQELFNKTKEEYENEHGRFNYREVLKIFVEKVNK